MKGMVNKIFTGIIKIFKKCLELLFKKNVEFVLEKKLKIIPDSKIKSDIKIKRINNKNISKIKKFISEKNKEKSLKAIDLYLKNGYNGFLAVVENKIAGYIWWVDNRVEVKNTHPTIIRYGLKLNDEQVYTFDYFVAPEFRGDGLALQILNLIQNELAKLGYKKAYGGVADHNIAAIFTYNVHGWKNVKKLTFIELFSFFLFSKGKIFLKNILWNRKHNFDFKKIVAIY